jgi:gluconate 2-dehydrogenase gamma chain
VGIHSFLAGEIFVLVPSAAMRRRHFLTLSGATLGGVVVYSLDRKVSLLKANEKTENKVIRIPLRFFDEAESLLVAAAVSRIFPSDESGPGAKEAGVVIYIDRQLAGPYGRDRYRYTQGPFEEAAPEFGYQGKATPREIYREGLKGLKGFDRWSADDQDAALERIEKTTFFNLLRQHTMEGMFCDPVHGGNAEMVGWQLIGFPGPRMNNYDEIEKYYGQVFRPKPASLREVSGHSVEAGEDEK